MKPVKKHAMQTDGMSTLDCTDAKAVLSYVQLCLPSNHCRSAAVSPAARAVACPVHTRHRHGRRSSALRKQRMLQVRRQEFWTEGWRGCC